MAEKLLIHVPGLQDVEVPLQPRTARLGRDRGCEVHIEHAEVAPHAATVDWQGGSFLIQNQCPFDIYLGQQPLAQYAWAVWPAGERLQLTRSVSLTLVSDRAATAATPGAGPSPEAADQSAEDATPSKKQSDGTKKLVQLVVIAVCVALAPLLLRDRSRTLPESADSFQDLVSALKDKQPLTESDELVCNYLCEAWMLEQRQLNSEDQQQATRIYQLLMEQKDIRSAEMDRSSLYGRIKLFAAHRVAALEKPGWRQGPQ